MASQKIILADRDLNYLLKLQIRLLEGVNGDVEIESISDDEYFREYLSIPRDALCFIVDGMLFSEDLLKHNIDNIVVLTDSKPNDIPDNNKIRFIDKYSSPNQIFNQIKTLLIDRLTIDQKKETEVLTFFSSSGGVGKTVLSLSMAKYLAERHYRVLYINTESIQSFSSYLDEESAISESVMMELETASSGSYKVFKHSIRRQAFDYLPQFPSPLGFYGISKDVYIELIQEICRSRNYDYIITDNDSVFDEATTDILRKSDKVFFITNKEDAILSTADRFLAVIDKRPGQYIYIRNNFTEEQACRTEQLEQHAADQYITHYNESGRLLVDILSRSDHILKLSLLID